MKKIKKTITLFSGVLLSFIFMFKSLTFGIGTLEELLNKYANENSIKKVLIVKTNSNESKDKNWEKVKSLAKVYFYEKDENNRWIPIFEEENAYIGENGPGKTEEGDRKTPLGEFNIVGAFGIKEKPKWTKLDYIKITDSIYACDEDCEYYNKIIDTKKVNHKCKGEHMIKYNPHYKYGLTIDFNKENDHKKGSNIFIHCFGTKPYTGGCVAFNKNKIKDIILKSEPFDTKVCII